MWHKNTSNLSIHPPSPPPASAPKLSPANRIDMSCLVCNEHRRNVLVLPCRHLILCTICYDSLQKKECIMYVLDAMQRHTDERHLHYNAVGLACVLIPKLRRSIESNHTDTYNKKSKKMKDTTTSSKMRSSSSLPSLTRGKTGKTLMSNLNKGGGMGMRALKKMTQKNAKFKELPILFHDVGGS